MLALALRWEIFYSLTAYGYAILEVVAMDMASGSYH